MSTPVAADPVQTVMTLALGYLMSRSLHVAAELGIADHLSDGPRTPQQLAASTGAHAPSLQRLLRALAAHGVFVEDSEGRFATTAAADLLRRGVMRDGVLLCGDVSGDAAWWNAVGDLRHSVLTGEPAFERQQRTGFFDYVTARAECGAFFDRGMANFAAAENPAIAAARDWSDLGHVVDVGGGQGGLLAQILERAPRLRATLFDLPQVAARPEALAAAGHLAGRWQVAAGDFFEAVPAGADAYLLKRILHDWGDEPCVRLLRRCREAMRADSVLLVVDAVLPPGNAPHPGKVMDMLMMVLATGRERGQGEFEALLQRAGLRLAGVTPTASALSIVEARCG